MKSILSAIKDTIRYKRLESKLNTARRLMNHHPDPLARGLYGRTAQVLERMLDEEFHKR